MLARMQRINILINYWWEYKMLETLRKQLGRVLRNLTCTLWPSKSHLGTYPREMDIYLHTISCKLVFIAALFLIAKTGNTLSECLDKRWYNHTKQYYSAAKRNQELLTLHTPYNWDDSLENGIEWKKSIPKGCNAIWFHLFDILEMIKLQK